MLTDLDLHKLDPSVRRVWTIKLAFTGLVLLFVAAAYDILNLFDADRALPLGLASAGVLVVFACAAWFIPGLRYRFWGYRLTDEELVIERGILNRVRTIVPLRRVQHLDVSQDIIEREFELAKLIVHTAGARSSEVVLPGLQMASAEQLRDRIKTYVRDEPV